MKIKHILVCGDNHGDKVNTDVAKKLFEWRDSYKWDHVIHLGDIFDFRPFRKGASDEEKGHGIRHDIKCGLDFLEKYRPTLITWGNHDWRPFQWAEDYADGLKQEYAQEIVRELKSWLAIKDITATPYHIRDNCINVCGINFTHGFRSSAVNPAKMLWENFGNAVCAHGHKYDRYQANRHPREKAFMIPIVANIFMDYNNRTPASLGHCNGFAHIEVIEMKSGRTEWELYPILKEGKTWLTGQTLKKA